MRRSKNIGYSITFSSITRRRGDRMTSREPTIASNNPITAGICRRRNGFKGPSLRGASMSALGQKQTSDCRLLMSAIPPKSEH
jgi:hypothetical protein